MQKDVLSSRQLICITALYIIGSSSVIGSSGIAKRDTWIAMLLAILAAVPLVLLYARISTLYPGQTLFDIIYTVFGGKLGWLVTLATTVYCFQLGTLVLRDFPEFVHTASLHKTPTIVFTLFLGLVCAYLAKLGVSSFGKAGILFSWIVGFIVVFTFLFLIPHMDVKHLRPVLSTSWDVIALNSGKLLSAPFGETVLLLCLFCNFKAGQSKKRSFLIGLLLGGAYLVISVLRNIMALGAENFSSLYFPSYSAVSTINIGDFLQRVEVMVAGHLLICDIMKISIAIYATCLGVVKLLKLEDYKKVVLPITLLMVPLSTMAFDNTMQFFHWSPAYFLLSFPFELCIPLLLWLYGEIKGPRGTQ